MQPTQWLRCRTIIIDEVRWPEDARALSALFGNIQKAGREPDIRLFVKTFYAPSAQAENEFFLHVHPKITKLDIMSTIVAQQ